ncbi:hypothetical protein PQR16_37505, partial [Caballeronia glebae]
TAAGPAAVASGGGSTALGALSTASGSRAMAMGYGATATTDNSVALGANSTTSAVMNTKTATIGGTAYSFAGSNATGTVSVGGVNAERTITNVGAGQ